MAVTPSSKAHSHKLSMNHSDNVYKGGGSRPLKGFYNPKNAKASTVINRPTITATDAPYAVPPNNARYNLRMAEFILKGK